MVFATLSSGLGLVRVLAFFRVDGGLKGLFVLVLATVAQRTKPWLMGASDNAPSIPVFFEDRFNAWIVRIGVHSYGPFRGGYMFVLPCPLARLSQIFGKAFSVHAHERFDLSSRRTIGS